MLEKNYFGEDTQVERMGWRWNGSAGREAAVQFNSAPGVRRGLGVQSCPYKCYSLGNSRNPVKKLLTNVSFRSLSGLDGGSTEKKYIRRQVLSTVYNLATLKGWLVLCTSCMGRIPRHSMDVGGISPIPPKV